MSLILGSYGSSGRVIMQWTCPLQIAEFRRLCGTLASHLPDPESKARYAVLCLQMRLLTSRQWVVDLLRMVTEMRHRASHLLMPLLP